MTKRWSIKNDLFNIGGDNNNYKYLTTWVLVKNVDSETSSMMNEVLILTGCLVEGLLNNSLKCSEKKKLKTSRKTCYSIKKNLITKYFKKIIYLSLITTVYYGITKAY